MVSVRRRTIGGRTYYYLIHSVRENDRVEPRELYLGKKIPKNIEEVKHKFIHDIYAEKWYPLLEKIKAGYSKEQRTTPPSARKKELEDFMIKFTYDTQRIEGSTLSLRETALLLQDGITPPKSKPLHDALEAQAHKKLFYEMLEIKRDLSLALVQEWHYMLFKDSKPDIASIIRKKQVYISASKYIPPSPVEVFPMLMDFFRWYNRNKNGRIHPVELAALVQLKFVTIHPFHDGNGRISRLMMNFVLERKGYPMFNIPYEGRSSYYSALERSQLSKIESIFMNWITRNYVKQHRRYLKIKQ